jgi:uncharacterized protein with NRDE domain
MCLAIFSLNRLPDWPLIIAANRDELHTRPTLSAAPWDDATHILGGRDLEAGGTWLGMTLSGRVALLTNYREPIPRKLDAPSRGVLTENYLRGNQTAQAYAQTVHQDASLYNGFNLLVGDHRELWYCSNRSATPPQPLTAGVFGLSNAVLDAPWPKVLRTRQALENHLLNVTAPSAEVLFSILQDTATAAEHELPDTGVGLAREKILGSPFITDPRYGTRCTTIVLQHVDGKAIFLEKRYNALGQAEGIVRCEVDTKQQKILA